MATAGAGVLRAGRTTRRARMARPNSWRAAAPWLAPLLAVATRSTSGRRSGDPAQLHQRDAAARRRAVHAQTYSQTLSDPTLARSSASPRSSSPARSPGSSSLGLADRPARAAGRRARAARRGARALRRAVRVGDAGHPHRRRLADRAQRGAVRAGQLLPRRRSASGRSPGCRTPSWRRLVRDGEHLARHGVLHAAALRGAAGRQPRAVRGREGRRRRPRCARSGT
jgi:hypothetical protein